MNINGIITRPPRRTTQSSVNFDHDRTIERIEEKYLLTRSEKNALMKAINKRLKHDTYYKEEVLSLYLDTANFDLAIKSLDRPNFRTKIRIRAYNIPKRSTKVFFEVKSKLAVGKQKVGNKRRLIIPLKDFYAYLKSGDGLERTAAIISDGDPQQIQVAKELNYLFKIYNLRPQVLIASNRTAFVGKEYPNFRLTFDENLRFRTTNLKLEKGGNGEKYFPTAQNPKRNIIMEAKTMRAMPPWFVAELSKLKIYPTRFSKYGKIYQLIKERNQINV